MRWGRALAAVVVASGLGVAVPDVAVGETAYAGPACTITGTRGADVLRGTHGPDVICGGRGADKIRGRDGRDLLLGGSDDDVLMGGDGDDRLYGGAGGDDVYDAEGQIDGGRGVDYCPWDADSTACETSVDTQIDLVGSNLPPSIELSGAAQDLRVRIHLRDLLGVWTTDVSLTWDEGDNTGVGTRLHLGSGTRRDGWWVGSLEVPGHQPSGAYSFSVVATSRSGTAAHHSLSCAIDNTSSDAEPPGLAATSGIAPGEQLPLEQPLVLDLAVTDELAGVRSVDVRWWNTATTDWIETEARREAGTARNGTWQATLDRPRRLRAGPSEFSVNVVDRAGNREQYWGPWLTDWMSAIAWSARPIPDDAGPFELVP